MQVEKLKTIDADTLLSTPMRKTLFVVDGLIPQGLSVLSGSSKIGKSWLQFLFCGQFDTPPGLIGFAAPGRHRNCWSYRVAASAFESTPGRCCG